MNSKIKLLENPIPTITCTCVLVHYHYLYYCYFCHCYSVTKNLDAHISELIRAVGDPLVATVSYNFWIVGLKVKLKKFANKRLPGLGFPLDFLVPSYKTYLSYALACATRPERLKGAKDKVKGGPKDPLIRSMISFLFKEAQISKEIQIRLIFNSTCIPAASPAVTPFGASFSSYYA